jgi:hypothetical protein
MAVPQKTKNQFQDSGGFRRIRENLRDLKIRIKKAVDSPKALCYKE